MVEAVERRRIFGKLKQERLVVVVLGVDRRRRRRKRWRKGDGSGFVWIGESWCLVVGI